MASASANSGSEGATYEAFEAAVGQDGMHTFLDETDAVPTSTRH